MRIVTRKQWGMPPPGPNHTERARSSIREANVHHSDSPPPVKHSACAGVVLGFDHYHRSKGWACIGYNRIICTHGYVFIGRPLTMVPAAAEGHNEPIAAYCLISQGNERATREQWAALVAIVEHDSRRIGHALRWTTHREVEPPGYTECPGDGIEAQVRQHRHH